MKLSKVILFLAAVLALSVAARFWLRPSPPPPGFPRTFVRDATDLDPRVFRAGAGVEPDNRSAAPRKRHGAKQHSNSAEAFKVSHQPQQPKSGQPVRITAEFQDQPAAGQLSLEYQIVDPGKYIALDEPAFEKGWTSLPMSQHGDHQYTVEVPSGVQKHRRLVRYRVRSAAGKVVAPGEKDAQPNYAYFVYDGVPAWKGAINPNSRDAKLREPVTYSSEALQRVPVYHFISSRSAVERATWTDPDRFGGRDRNAYNYTGTLVYDGVVYDHIGFRARGGSWRHAMGKNMWKFNFLPGHRFEARDSYGNPYKSKWDKLNLGACIQQGDYGMRGEQGMFESVGFRLFNLAGLEAPQTHFVHLRIIDQAQESPSDQYSGDFWGLYLAVENVDEHFLKEHQLPQGNLYKMEFRPKTAFNGNPAVTNQSDVNEFIRATMRRQQSDSWWQKNVDLDRYYDYRAILECIHHYDVDGGKNYFYYLNPETQKWIVIPWDIDLTWGDQMFGGGFEPFYRAGALSYPTSKLRYQERLAEIRDLLFNPEQVGLLIDEYAAMISDPSGSPSLVGADRAKWDYNPVLASSHVFSMKAGQGRFYFANPRNSFQAMVAYMKSYAAKRAKWVDSRLLGNYRPPTPPQVNVPAKIDLSAPSLTFQLNSNPDNSGALVRWRLAEVTQTNSPAFNPRQPWKYEIQALWEQELKATQSAAVPTKLLVPGHTYRARARWQDADGRWSRWSPPAQFTVPAR